MKHSLLFLSVLFLFSCFDTNVKTTMLSESSVDTEIDQQRVVNTDFDNSILYHQFAKWRTEGPIIPGLLQTSVPQGMAYLEKNNQMIISNYMSDDSAGTLSFVSMDDGSFDKVLFLYNEDGTSHKGHLGGLAISRDFLWLASGKGVYFISLETLQSAVNLESITLPELIITETKGSFATFYNNILWIGEFTRTDGTYPVPDSHHKIARDGNSHRGWLAGYQLDMDSDMIDLNDTVSGKVVPNIILSIPDEIQGAAFVNDKIVLSASFGRKNYSRLLLFNNPLKEAAHQSQKTFQQKERFFWFLDELNKIAEIHVPPMSEAVVEYKSGIAVLFESASVQYRNTALFPLDRIQLLPLEVFVSQ